MKQQAAARALFRLAGGAATSATSPASLYMGWVAASVALQARSALRGRLQWHVVAASKRCQHHV